MSCKIYTLSLTGRKREVCVNSEEEMKNMTLKEFVRRFCPEEEDLDFCRYIFDGKLLEDDQTLGYYGIKHGSSIHTYHRIRGGGALTYPDEEEDEDKGMSRTESMEIIANMQQTEPESSSCCML